MADTAKFDRKMRAMRIEVSEAMRVAMERWADRVVKDMRLLLAAQHPRVFGVAEVAWTWGDAPAGAVTLQKFGGRETDAIALTIYAKARQGSGISLNWFEFGTAPRVQKKTGRQTGRITAGPFFFPAWRANRKQMRTALLRTLRTAVRKINAT